MKELMGFLKPYWKITILAPLFMVLEVSMDLLQPFLMAQIVNEGVMKGDLETIQRTGGLMILVAFIGLIGGAGCTVFSSTASMNFATDLRKVVFDKVQSFSFQNLDKFKGGSLITRLTADIVQLQMFVMMVLRSIRSPLLTIGSVIMAFTISFKLALIFAATIPVLFIILYLLIRKAFPTYNIVQQKLDKVNTVLQENLMGIRVVKAFVRSDFENNRFGQANEDYTNNAVRAARIVSFNMPVLMLILNFSLVIILWFGAHQTWSGSLQVGDLIAFINYVTQVLFAVMMIGMMMITISRSKVSADRIQEVLHTDLDLVDHQHADQQAIVKGEVTFDRVSFSYDGQSEVLKDISLVARAGQTVAILGATGSGKSTMVQLIPRLYDATSGTVMIDGTDVRHIKLEHLRTSVGVVLQQSILFSGTIRDNIRYGKPAATQAEVELAAKAACAHEFIMTMPDGYDTVLGQRGMNLSGGQKQRISIARALLVRPVILILDDSTSAVDLGTESRIQKALGELLEHSTAFIIAQRISSVMEADKIVVLEDGRISAEGTHEQLMKTSEVYQEIYRSQLGKEEVVYE
ncbi:MULTISPECIES: ABC transporter ATP-binding protein [unclassified Niallia]|uniref:ABC transporter ATP-binding protein n=1 Tax=unclassified Niallia TaxID=2837522 RepID=UPI00203F201A|nr:ABC transporter ATP-binding protein [Niallia sp. MER 6]MCM3031622.1 ABC transporter ATP-binding protein/permease [Niallia sp. MER 6]